MTDTSIRRFSLVPYALGLLAIGALLAALTWPAWGVVPKWMENNFWPAWLQAVGSLFAIVVAIGVPARLASLDRRARAADARIRARSFALEHFAALEYLRDHLHGHRAKSAADPTAVPHISLLDVRSGFQECGIPQADLYLLGEAAEPIQRAFALAAKSHSMELRRNTAAQRGDDIVAYDERRNQLFLDAADAMDDGMVAIAKLLH